MPSLTGRKVLFIIAPNRFRDEELFETKKVLDSEGATTVIACSSLMTATGTLGASATPDISLKEVKVEEFDAIAFIGGSGAALYLHDPLAHSIAIQAEKLNKVLAAICMAPSILANAGLLSGRKVTAFQSEEQNIRQKGGNFTGGEVETDGNLITANGSQSAKKFGEAIVKALS